MLTDEKHPQFEVTFGGKYAHRDPERVDAEEYIAKKGIAAKGKKCHQYDLEAVRFVEPLHKDEDDIPQEEPADIIAAIEENVNDIPDTDRIPDIGDLEEPTLF